MIKLSRFKLSTASHQVTLSSFPLKLYFYEQLLNIERRNS